MNWGEALSPLRNKNFRWFFWSRTVNLTGAMMASIALAFAVLEIEDSATAIGQVLAARSIPLVVFLLIGGVVADRFDRRVVLQISNVTAALSQGVAAVLVISGHAHLWQLIVLEAVNGTVSAASFPAMQGMIPQLVPRSELQQANAMLSMTRGALAILGPSIAGLLVVTVGPGWALAVDASTWLIAAVLLLPVRLAKRAVDAAPANMLRELAEGWTLFRTTTWLWVVVLAFSAMNMIQTGWYTIGPAIANHTIGARGWGYTVSAQAVGLLLMSTLMLRVRFRHPLRAGMLGCSLFALPLIVLGVHPTIGLLIVVTAVSGAGMEIFGIGWSLAMQGHIREDLLSRAYSYDALGSYVALPIGQLLYGPMSARFGNERVLVISGVVFAAIAGLTLTSRSVRNLGHAPAEAEPVATQ